MEAFNTIFESDPLLQAHGLILWELSLKEDVLSSCAPLLSAGAVIRSLDDSRTNVFASQHKMQADAHASGDQTLYRDV